jgi:hypothetical protein
MYWKNRTKIGNEMLATLNSHMMKGGYANVTGFMLLKITMPNSYEQAIVET